MCILNKIEKAKNMNLKQRIKEPKFDDETFLMIIVAISAIMFLTMGFMLYTLGQAGITQEMSIKQAAKKFDQSITRTYEDFKQASEDSPIRL